MKRLHVHVGVSDLDQSIAFYSTLFGAPPSVVKADYAKWLLDDPRVNFAISSGHHAAKGVEHPFCIVGLHHARPGPEQGRIEMDGLVEILDPDMDVKALHAVFLCSG